MFETSVSSQSNHGLATLVSSLFIIAWKSSDICPRAHLLWEIMRIQPSLFYPTNKISF